MGDPYNLQRFVDAQAGVLDAVRAELSAGHKRTHWIWFIFPQIAGLGNSAMSRHYAISGRAEALAYLEHPVLGTRLRECTQLVNEVTGRSAYQIFGDPDRMKFQSCMTLFAAVAHNEPVFRQALAKYYEGGSDRLTMGKLAP